jgi:hypothetical protein
VTQISGRDIGMDVVRNEIVALAIDVHAPAPAGHAFNLFLPLTLVSAVGARARTGWAIAPMVEQVQQIRRTC